MRTFTLAAVAAAVLLPASVAGAATGVSPGALNGWQTQTVAGTTLTASVGFVTGPLGAPLGIGSAQLSVGSDGDGAAQLRDPDFAGVKLADLTALGYSTYVQHDGSGGQAPYIILNVDNDGDGSADDLLFFEPVYQSATYFPSNPQGPLTTGTWQSWNALLGGWYSVNGIADANPGTGVKSLGDYLAAEPNATIVNSSTGLGGVRLVAGFGAGSWDNFVGDVDAFAINASTFNFEPAPSKDQCKKLGFANFGFANQGQCVKAVPAHH